MRRPSRDDRGAVLVEAAFITVLLLMLLLGTVTSAIAFSQKSALQTSAREASRFGSALAVEGGNLNTWLGEVMDVAKSASNGNLGSEVPGQKICVAYVYPNGTSTSDRTTRMYETAGVRSGAATGSKAWCYEDGRPDDERRVQVVVERKASINAAVITMDVDLSVPTVARFERG